MRIVVPIFLMANCPIKLKVVVLPGPIGVIATVFVKNQMRVLVPVFSNHNFVVELKVTAISFDPSSIVIPLLVVDNPIPTHKVLVPAGPEAVIGTFCFIVPNVLRNEVLIIEVCILQQL